MAAKGNAAWHRPDGSPVSCAEKIKVLDQNLAEFRAVALDFLCVTKLILLVFIGLYLFSVLNSFICLFYRDRYI